MKKVSIYLVALFAITIIKSCNNNSTTDHSTADTNILVKEYSGPPYTIQLVEFVNNSLPDLHSYTHATYGDKIVMLGGRTNGLHAGTYKFNQDNANDSIYVIDTKGWDNNLTNWQVYSAAAKAITTIDRINNDHFLANNAEFFTKDSVLYMLGGLLGASAPTKLPLTMPYMTAINLPTLITSVINKQALTAGSIRQVVDSSFAITGGELSVIVNTVYLVFGWNFPKDLYTHQVQSFTFKDDGHTITINHIPVCPTCKDNYVDSPKTSTGGNFRRRDGSMTAMIDPGANEMHSLLYFAGVFKNGNTNFTSPVWINGNSAAEDTSFVMLSNVYTCQVVPVYSKQRKECYATMLGGMKNAQYTGGAITKPVLLQYKGADANTTLTPPDLALFTSIPFSNQFTTISVNAAHQYAQYLLPDSFPNSKIPYTLPFVPATATTKAIPALVVPAGSVFYNGSESEITWAVNKSALSNGVIDYDAFINDNPAGGNIGYLHGGILSYQPNVFGPNSVHYSIASNRIFAIRIVPLGK
ncbi:hypothetical protein [Ferruginibacter sp.]